MSADYFYVPGTFPLMGHFLQCTQCGRKILVSIVLNGTNHNMSVSVCCADCLSTDDEFTKEYPEVSKKIENWTTRKDA